MSKKPYILLFLILSVLFILFFGLRVKAPSLVNDIQWLKNETGLYFNENSFAYTKSFFPCSIPTEGITIEMALKPHFYETPRFSMILQIYNKTDDSQLTIGQWDKSLVILNNNDYSNNKRLPKIYTSFDQNGEVRLLTILSNKDGTIIYLDGKQIKHNTDLILAYPQDPQNTNLIVGNSIVGRNPWRGTLYDLALYDRPLSEDSIIDHYLMWEKNRELIIEKPYLPQLFYSLQKETGSTMKNRMELPLPLILPANFIVLKKTKLRMPDIRKLHSETMKIDLFLNYSGFIPFGFLFFLFFTTGGPWKKQMILAIILITSFLLSLSIELLQVHIVLRDSSLLDLLLNSLGGLSGGLLASHFKS